MPTVIDNRNYVTMRMRIATEVKRDNLDTLIGQFIGDAIYYYQSQKFFFQETTDNSTITTQGVNTYNPPGDLENIDKLEITIVPAGLVEELHLRSLDWILKHDVTVPPEQGRPTDYCFYANQVRLYITPDQGPYQLTYYYKGQIPPPVQDTDAGYWMTTGELMIRSYAKGLIYGSVLRNPQQMQVEMGISHDAFVQLSGRNYSLQFTGRTKSTKF